MTTSTPPAPRTQRQKAHTLMPLVTDPARLKRSARA